MTTKTIASTDVKLKTGFTAHYLDSAMTRIKANMVESEYVVALLEGAFVDDAFEVETRPMDTYSLMLTKWSKAFAEQLLGKPVEAGYEKAVKDYFDEVLQLAVIDGIALRDAEPETAH
jgi:hypothetical protein